MSVELNYNLSFFGRVSEDCTGHCDRDTFPGNCWRLLTVSVPIIRVSNSTLGPFEWPVLPGYQDDNLANELFNAGHVQSILKSAYAF